MSDTNRISVAFHLTHQCNLRCNYCYTGEKLNIPMTQETADEGINFVLREVAKNKVENLEIVFFGGEPLIEKKLLFYIADQFIARKGDLILTFNMSTNGTLLNPATMKELMDRQVFVSLSVDGHPEIQDVQRQNAAGKGTSKQVTKAIKLLLNANPCANVTCVITPFSAGQVMESVDYLHQQGFKYITTTLDYSGDWTAEDMKTLEGSLHKLSDWYYQQTLAAERFYLNCFDDRIQSRTQKELMPSERCHLGIRQFSIAPDGEIYPCIQFVTTEKIPEFMIGHVKDGFNEECRNFISQNAEQEKKECSGCALKSRCSSWCACVNYMSTGSIQKASPIVCHYERILMPIADKLANKLWKKRNRLFIHKQYNPLYPIISFVENSH